LLDNVFTLFKIQKHTRLYNEKPPSHPYSSTTHFSSLKAINIISFFVILPEILPETSKLNQWLSNHALVAQVTIEVTEKESQQSYFSSFQNSFIAYTCFTYMAKNTVKLFIKRGILY
jgi:hypothetical protein